MSTVLIIDDHVAVCDALELLLSLHDIHTVTAVSPEQGLQILAQTTVDVVIQDMNFSADTTSGAEGVALFRAIRRDYPDLPIILLTAWTQLEAAVDLVKSGAADYLAKPWDDAKLLTVLKNLIELADSQRELRKQRAQQHRDKQRLHQHYDLQGFIFSSPAMARVLELACQVAYSSLPVLITGPNGAGKERIAQIVHANSSVRHGAMVAVNCGALPAELIEAELFGAEAGAYTGASKARPGRFELADGGSLFLDEIGNLPLAGQIKLLRVLETGQFERLGSGRTRQVSVRVISATNANLRAMVESGHFREDLYYRLNVIEVALPPLAERSEDILPLTEHFLAGRGQLSDSARRLLPTQAWPGNVRQLKNAIERALVLARDDEITPELLGLVELGASSQRNLDEPSPELIRQVLNAAGGKVSKAALDLGMSRQALYRRLERYGLQLEVARELTR